MNSPVARTAKKTNIVSWKPFILNAPVINFVVPQRVYLTETSENKYALENGRLYIAINQ